MPVKIFYCASSREWLATLFSAVWLVAREALRGTYCIPTEEVGITTLQESDGTDGFFIISCDIYGSHFQTFLKHISPKKERRITKDKILFDNVF